MSIWKSLVTALRGGVNELGEAVVDNQALRILDQEIRDADHELRQSKTALAEIMAKCKMAEDSAKSTKTSIKDYEEYTLKALDKGEESLAQEIAQKIAHLETQLGNEQSIAKNYGGSVSNLRSAVTQAEGNLKRLKQQADTVKATESVQKAQAAVASRYSGSNAKMQTAMESLERIKQIQAERKAKMEAAEELEAELSGDDLDAKMREAGITADTHSAQNVLDRLKAKSK